jgi:membrane protease YdiL (CAAX protease family)
LIRLVNSRKVLVFLALAYAFAWTVGFTFFALGGKITSGAFLIVGVVCMWAPAVAAIITQKLIWKEPLGNVGIATPRMRWLLVAWLGPILLVLLALGFSLMLPGILLSTGLDGLLAALADLLPASEVAKVQRHLEPTFLAKPGMLLLITFAQVLLAGPTVNAGAAFGEELGWRGVLVRELEPLGFWRSSFVIGFFWGLWHLPLIVNGHNYPGHPLVGPIMMTLLTILLSPLIGYVRLQARSVFAAAVFHGTFNAAAGLAIFLKGGTALLTGMTGVVGLMTLLLVDAMLWLHLRRNPVRDGL